MKLSMSMLAWYLRNDRIQASIENDRATMKGIRFLSEDQMPPTQDYAFIGPGRYFLADKQFSNSSIVACGQSYLYSLEDDYEHLLNRVLEAFDFFNNWEARLAEASRKHAELQEIADIVAEVMQNPLLITGPDSAILAWTAPVESGLDDPFWDEAITSGRIYLNVQNEPLFTTTGSSIREFNREPLLVRNVYSQAEPVLMTNLQKDGDYLATIGVKQVDASLEGMNRQLLDVTLPHLCQAREFSRAGSSARGGTDVVRDAICGEVVHPHAARRFENTFIAPPYRLLAMEHTTRADQQSAAWLLESAENANVPSVQFKHESRVIAVVAESQLQAFIDALANMDSFYRKIGVSAPVSSIHSLSKAYHQALYSLSCLQGQPGVAYCEDVAFAYLLDLLRGLPETHSFLHPALGLLQRYDDDNNGELLHTLRQFVLSGRSMARTAEALNVHKNTLKYRMARIRDITHVNTGNAEDMDYLALSVRLAGETDPTTT